MYQYEGPDNGSCLHLFSQTCVPKVSNNLIQQCREYSLECNRVLSSVSDSSLCSSRSAVGAGELYIPCPPPLISDRLFGISSLHQLDPLTDNLLHREGWGLPGCWEKKAFSQRPRNRHLYIALP